jgi:hypothetical protein
VRLRAASLGFAFVLSSLGVRALATDRPIDGQRLVLRQTGATAKLVFVSRDPDFLFPAIGGPDDPSTGSPGGATVELFSASEGQASLGVPPDSGTPGWTVVSDPPYYKFRNRLAPGGISPVRVAVLRDGKTLKIVAKDAGLPLAVAQGAVGIRITTGTLRNCARFAGSTIRKDEPGAFVASRSTPDPLFLDCSDTSMNGEPPACDVTPYPACGSGTCPGDGVCVSGFAGVFFCHCVSPSQPCGDTAPMCSGTCPVGEDCFSVGPGPFPGCVCLPEGSTPCGDPGPPVCGGACPSGTTCEPIVELPIFGGGLGCVCAPPGGQCGSGGVDCPNGYACAAIPLSTGQCVPITCGGPYPTCGGECVSGAVCQPLKAVVGPDPVLEECLCALPAPCDAACGGYTCASGEVCTWAGGACGCEVP